MPDHDTRTDENTIDDLKAGQGAREGSAEPGAAGPLPGQPRRGPNRTKADLTKVSANFVNRSLIALELASEVTGDNQTDVLNRSVQLYAYIMKAVEDGKLIFIEDPRTGAKERLVLL